MAKRKVAKKVTTLEAADARFIPVAKAFARNPKVSLMESKSGAMRGLMLDGKSFGMSSNGRFMLKLNEELASALISDGIGKPFSPSAGRVMKGWIEVTHPQANWVALAQEAHQLAAAKKPATKRPKR